jgi:hypothetical protein
MYTETTVHDITQIALTLPCLWTTGNKQGNNSLSCSENIASSQINAILSNKLLLWLSHLPYTRFTLFIILSFYSLYQYYQSLSLMNSCITAAASLAACCLCGMNIITLWNMNTEWIYTIILRGWSGNIHFTSYSSWILSISITYQSFLMLLYIY